MRFHRSNYLSWYRPRLWRGGDDAVDLHSSGVPWVQPHNLVLPAVDAVEVVVRFEAAVASWLGLPAQQVVFSPGATGGTLLALLTLAGKADEIVVETPIYEPLLRQAERLGGTVHRLPRSAANGWQLPIAEAREVIGDRTSVVLITEPHNPSGVLAPRSQVLELAAIAAARGAILLVNEVYRGFCATASFHGLAENIVVVSSFSKLLGAYWARVGWLSATDGLADHLRRAHWNMSIPSAAGAQVGLAFLENIDDRVRIAVAAAQAGAGVVDRWVDAHAHAGLSWHRPNGPGFGLVTLPAGVDDVALAERLHDRDNVLLVPGSLFSVPGTLRVSWVQAGDRLREGLSAVGAALPSALQLGRANR